MNANKLNTYQSTYNTQVVSIPQKTGMRKAQTTLKSVAVEKVIRPTVNKCGNKVRAGNFDFAGLAG